MDENHIPMKDQFSGDESEIEILDKEEDILSGQPNKIKKIKKKFKNFTWKLKWVPIPNSVANSDPVFVRRWVKIKVENLLEEQEYSREESEEKRKLNGNIRDIAAQIIENNNEQRKEVSKND